MTPTLTISLILLLCALCSTAAFMYGRQFEHAKWLPIISERNDLVAQLRLYRSNAAKTEAGIREQPTKLKLMGRVKA